MAGADRAGIPAGLNRIRTRWVPPEDQSSSGGDNSPASVSRRDASGGVGIGRDAGAGNGKGSRKGRKIARWISSYITNKDHSKASLNNIPPNAEVKGSDGKMHNQKDLVGSGHSVDQNDIAGKQSVSESNSIRKKPVTIKSFSHELGPKGGVRASPPRARSYSDLKELFGSLHSKFDAAKEVVNVELAAFEEDLIDALENDSSLTEHRTAGDLLVLSKKCKKMSSSQFRANCENIVQNLSQKRQQCHAGSTKQLLTRMLFILTRCTRLLQFQKDTGSINESSLDKFKQCLERVPAVEMKWVPKPGKEDSTLDNTVKRDHISSTERNEITIHSRKTIVTESGASSFSSQFHPINDDFQGRLLQRREECSEGSESVMCRICETNVPTSHLESHSYVCAYAAKCDLEGLDVDERLARIAEILEQIMESYNPSSHAADRNPEVSRIQSAISAIGSEGHSPKVQEWHNKGTEGMFEDLHELDTSCIDDSYIASTDNLKSLLSMKLGPCIPTSSNGSMTPASSTTTPRSSYFDLYWLEHNNPSEHEDLNQMNEMADIARKVAHTNVATAEASEHLGMWLHDLLDILQHSQLKALVIDTFGSRILDMLKEKYVIAIEVKSNKEFNNTIQLEEARGHFIHNSSQSSILAPSRASNKERTSIDDFEIIKPISRGAFGKVFLARKRTTGDLFAIKVLKKLDMIRKNDIERILAERNILIAVRNPFVVRFFYSFTCRDNLYLVMEYLNGGDLYSFLRNVGCLEEDVARIYIAELVLALEYLHSLGIIHRDLKPDNILIARDGHIKLTDFGLSKIGLINSSIDLSGGKTGSILLDTQNHDRYHENAHISEKSSRNSAVGTPDYLAPEILLGTAHGYAADWWSVGIILFEFLTGIPPFTAGLPEIIFDNILNRKIPWPCVPDDMSYEAKDLIDRFLIQDQDLRLGSKGASEVKAHPFFKEVNWDNLALQKAAFIPHPGSEEDTSYFTSRYSPSSWHIQVDENYSDCASDISDSSSISDFEANMDECNEVVAIDVDGPGIYVDLSSISFSFKNLSQLATMNYDVLQQSGRTSKCSSPSNPPFPQP